MSRPKADRNREHALRLLTNGKIQLFNDWRRSRKLQRINLHTIDFTKLPARSDIDFVDVILSKCVLVNSTLKSLNMRNARFRKASCKGADFSHSDLSGADFGEARLANTNFDGCNLTGTDLHGSMREGWSIVGARCEYCWISKPRSGNEGSPDRFDPGQFEIVHGGHRVLIEFGDDFSPIDLLAFPFYASELIQQAERCGAKITLAGLDTLERPSIAFKFERRDDNLEKELSKALHSERPRLRDLVASEVAGGLRAHPQEHSVEVARLQAKVETLQGTIEVLAKSMGNAGSQRVNFNLKVESNQSQSIEQTVDWGPLRDLIEGNDTTNLAHELNSLREALLDGSGVMFGSKASSDAIGVACESLESNDPNRVLASLKRAGSVALATAKELCLTAAEAAISTAIEKAME